MRRWIYTISTHIFSAPMVVFESEKPGLSNCERIVPLHKILNVLQHFKIRLSFFKHPVQCQKHHTVFPTLSRL